MSKKETPISIVEFKRRKDADGYGYLMAIVNGRPIKISTDKVKPSDYDFIKGEIDRKHYPKYSVFVHWVDNKEVKA